MIPYTPHTYIGIAADGEAKSRTVKFGFLHIFSASNQMRRVSNQSHIRGIFLRPIIRKEKHLRHATAERRRHHATGCRYICLKRKALRNLTMTNLRQNMSVKSAMAPPT